MGPAVQGLRDWGRGAAEPQGPSTVPAVGSAPGSVLETNLPPLHTLVLWKHLGVPRRLLNVDSI